MYLRKRLKQVSSSPTLLRPFVSYLSTTVAKGELSTTVAKDKLSTMTVAKGELVRMEHTFRSDDVVKFAAVSGDLNPIHTDKATALSAGFKACVVHGMLCAGLFSSLVQSRFPGACFTSKTLRFKEPAFVGDCLEAEVKVAEVHHEDNGGIRIELNMECYKKEGRVSVIEGKSQICHASQGTKI